LARRQGATVELSNGDWLIRVRAGPNKARGYITSIDDNSLGPRVRVCHAQNTQAK
jgi:hypothetical protein